MHGTYRSTMTNDYQTNTRQTINLTHTDPECIGMHNSCLNQYKFARICFFAHGVMGGFIETLELNGHLKTKIIHSCLLLFLLFIFFYYYITKIILCSLWISSFPNPGPRGTLSCLLCNCPSPTHC